MLLTNKLHGTLGSFIIDGFHTLLGQRAGVFHFLTTLAIGPGVNHTAGAKLFGKGFAVGHFHLAGVILVFRFLFRVQVVEVTEKLIKTVHGGQMFIAIPLMVLAELSGGVTLTFQDGGHGDVFLVPALFGTGETHFGHAAAHRH